MMASVKGRVSVCELLLNRGSGIDHKNKAYNIIM